MEERIPGCGGTYTAEEGTIQSPHIDQQSMSCEYEMRMPASESIAIQFQTFDMNEHDCVEVGYHGGG